MLRKSLLKYINLILVFLVMRYASAEEAKVIENYMKIAAEEAKKSSCLKSQRGVIIVKDGKIVGRGFNKPTLENLCCLRESIKDNSRVELCTAVHAEQMAILSVKNKDDLKDSVMYHIKVKNNEMRKTNEEPSCTVCSRLVLESGIKEFVLWYEQGYRIYSAREFNEASFQFFQSQGSFNPK